jgi:pyridoxamine 5'-phosphate oxidase
MAGPSSCSYPTVGRTRGLEVAQVSGDNGRMSNVGLDAEPTLEYGAGLAGQHGSQSGLAFGKAVADQRLDYQVGTLDLNDLTIDPFAQFDRWFAEAFERRELDEPSAMTLATATSDGVPSARTVLLKGFDQRGFVWFTNYQSRKGSELEQNPVASLCFRWATWERQVVICGPVSRVDPTESDEYFLSRPVGSRVGAVVSAQSTVIPDRVELEASAALLLASVDSGADVNRPENWGGFRLSPVTVEFWQGRSSRLHDRLRFRRETSAVDDHGWIIERLSP